VAEEAVVLVDMLKGFLVEGYPLFCGQQARSIIGPVVSLLDAKPDAPRIYVCDRHKPDDPEFEIFAPHCLEGTQEAGIVDELLPYPGTVVAKRTYDPFFGTEFEQVLAQVGPETVYVVGVCTDICVLYTVAGLRLRGYRVIVPKRCVASFDKESHNWALRHFERVLGARIE